MKKQILSLLFLITVFSHVNAQEYFKDITFGNNGIVFPGSEISANSFGAMEILDDGKIIAAGHRTPYGSDIIIGRFNVDGSLDETFGTDGYTIIDISDHDLYFRLGLEVLNDGKILVSFYADNQICNIVAKLNSDGTMDAEFGTNGIASICYTDVIGSGLIIQQDGKIIITGYTQDTLPTAFAMIRFNANGFIDNSFGENGVLKYNVSGNDNPDLWSTSLSAFQDEAGYIFMAGYSYDISVDPLIDSIARCMTVACFNSDGTFNNDFGINGVLHFNLWSADWWQINDFVVTDDNKIIYTGTTGNYLSEVFVGKIDFAGNNDIGFNETGYKILPNSGNWFYDYPYVQIELNEDDDIYIKELSITIADTNFCIIKLKGDGSYDNTFGNSGRINFVDENYFFCADFDVQPDGKIVCVGESLYTPFICRLVEKNNVLGKIFIDDNENGILDNNEQGVAQHIVKVEPGPYYSTTNNNGYYYFSGDPGTYTMTYLLPPYWAMTSENSFYDVEILNQDNSFTGLDFGVIPKENITDVAINITGGPTRPLFNTAYWLSFSSFGTNTQQGAISFQYDPLLTFISSDYTPLSHVDNIITWEYDTLTSMEQRNIYLEFQVPGIEYLDDTLVSFCSISPFAGDTLLFNNYDTIRQVITGSYDPNDKQVSPAGYGDENLVLHDTKLTYTIRFQNTGSDTAFNIIVIDSIDNNLNIESFQLLASSHPCTYTISGQPGSKTYINFNFPDILLPNDEVDELGSNGFVKFRIEPKQGLSDFTQANNEAYIYFDYNPPIITNMVSTTFVSTINNIIATEEQEYHLYPNPTNGIINIESPNLISVSLYSIDGKLIKTFNNSDIINLTNFSSGIYLLNIKTANGSYIEKIIRK